MVKKDRRKLAPWTKSKMMAAFDLVAFGYNTDTNWYKAGEPLKPREAAAELWFSTVYYYKVKNKYPELQEYFESIMEHKRKKIGNYAEQNIEDAISSNKLDISDKDKVDFSFRLLEKTNKAYNPKTEIEANVNQFMLDMSEEEIQAKILELMPNIWKKK